MSLGRTLAILFGLCSLAMAQPSLTTIEDTIYKADGTRFNGSATISWPTFQANDMSKVGMQSILVPIQNGILWVQLVPNMGVSPAAPYTVNYNSDGRQQFTETWTVPATTKILRVRDVRTDTNSVLTGTAPQNQTPLLETDIVGLVADLGLRLAKGPDFGTGRAAVINSLGQIDAAIGNLGDCLHVDGTSAPCSSGGGTSAAFVDAESPTGVVDGVNSSFQLANTPSPLSSLALFRNGMLQKPGLDYTVSNATIQFLTGAIPQQSDTLVAYYRAGAAGSITNAALGAMTVAGSVPLPTSAPEVICSSLGTSTNGGGLAGLGSCGIPANTFRPGDRVEIRFDYVHQGAGSGFSIQVNWGATPVVERNADSAEGILTGRVEVAIGTGSESFGAQNWGMEIPLQSTAGIATDRVDRALQIGFSALSRGDTVALRNFAVIRYPALSHP